IQGRAVEEVQEAVVAGRLEAQGAHDAGDPLEILASGHSREAEGHPQEGPGASAGGPQFAHQLPPMVPEHEAASLPVGSNFAFSVLRIVRHSIAYICYTNNDKRRLSLARNRLSKYSEG